MCAASQSINRPFGSTIVAPGAQDVLNHFHNNNQTVGSFITSIYLLGYVFGPVSTAPLSEYYGRLPVYHASNVLFLVFNICCAVSPNIGALLAFRFFAGTFGATAITLGPASIADLYVKEERGVAFAAYAVGSLFGPVIGPVGECMKCFVDGKEANSAPYSSWRLPRASQRLEMGVLAVEHHGMCSSTHC